MAFERGHVAEHAFVGEKGHAPLECFFNFRAALMDQFSDVSQDWFGKIGGFRDIRIYARIFGGHDIWIQFQPPRKVNAFHFAGRTCASSVSPRPQLHVYARVQGPYLCHTRKFLHDVARFYTLGLLGGGRFFQRDSPSHLLGDCTERFCPRSSQAKFNADIANILVGRPADQLPITSY